MSLTLTKEEVADAVYHSCDPLINREVISLTRVMVEEIDEYIDLIRHIRKVASSTDPECAIKEIQVSIKEHYKSERDIPRH